MESMLYRKKGALIIFLGPAFLFMFVFLFYPFLFNIYNSFFDIRDISATPNPQDFSMQWYTYLMQDPDMLVALKNTLKLMGLAIVFQVGLALLLAILVDFIKAGSQFFRTIFFFPIVISSTAIGLLFTLFYIEYGALDQITTFLGIPQQYWLSEGLAFYMLTIPTLWQYVGFYFVILVTGLSSISEEVFEAAAIDGATGIQRTRYITLPLLYNVLTTCLMLSITGSLKVFDMFWTMLPNGLSGTFITGTYMYFMTDMQKLVSYGSTIAIVIVVLGVIVAQLCNLLFKPRDY